MSVFAVSYVKYKGLDFSMWHIHLCVHVFVSLCSFLLIHRLQGPSVVFEWRWAWISEHWLLEALQYFLDGGDYLTGGHSLSVTASDPKELWPLCCEGMWSVFPWCKVKSTKLAYYFGRWKQEVCLVRESVRQHGKSTVHAISSVKKGMCLLQF